MSEKRKYPRIKDEGISLKVEAGDVNIITKTLDLSASGVYCKIEKELPLLSRIQVTLVVPETKGKAPNESKKLRIVTEGVVVREHPVIIDGKFMHYDVAIFFDNISPKDKQDLLDYINLQLK
ncbi:MAG: PilZ domain-containing protein [Candidatus Omnitrophica bacterium]|nr:PilZ domain-containing protein [Candidatus Omnitrophota bacterium]